MECKFCHAENVDDAVFCKACGQRIDGMKKCPFCKKLVAEDAVYCNYCGKRIDGKKTCSSCGTTYEGKFCPKCGAPQGTAEHAEITDEIALPPASSWQGIVGRVGTSFALFAAVIALIFVFLIGFGISNAQGGVAGGEISVKLSESTSIYDYFGKIYEQIDDAIKQIESNNTGFTKYNFTEPALYIPAVLCTVTAAGALISVTTLSIIAIVKLIRKLSGKEEAKAEKYAAAAVFVYLMGAAVLNAFNQACVRMSYSSGWTGSVNIDVTSGYNPATVAGIVLGAIAIGVYIACKIAVKGAQLKNAKTLAATVIACVSLVIVGVAAHYASCASHTVSVTESESSSALSLPACSWLRYWASYLGWTDDGWDKEFFLITLAMFVQVALIAVAFATLISCWDVTKEKNRSALGMSIALTVASVAFLIVSAIATQEPMESAGEENMKITFAPCIAVLVLSVLNLGASIAKTVIVSKREQE